MPVQNAVKKIPVHLIYPTKTGKLKSEIPQEIPKSLISNPVDGIIKLDIACNKGTESLPESATNVARCVTCPKCQSTPEYIAVLRAQTPQDEGVEARILSDDDIKKLLNQTPAQSQTPEE